MLGFGRRTVWQGRKIRLVAYLPIYWHGLMDALIEERTRALCTCVFGVTVLWTCNSLQVGTVDAICICPLCDRISC
jgi:hypothetical protein